MTDHYQILGIHRDATPEQIRRAYQSAASLHHPDRGGDAEKFKAANEAHRVLMDRAARAKYDSDLASPRSKGVLATVSAKDYDAAAQLPGFAPLLGETCPFCDGEREVRVGAGGFWMRRKCPVCVSVTASAE